MLSAYELEDEPSVQRFREHTAASPVSHLDDEASLGFLDAGARVQIPFLDTLLGAIMNKFLGLTIKQVTDKFTNIISGEVLGKVIGLVGRLPAVRGPISLPAHFVPSWPVGRWAVLGAQRALGRMFLAACTPGSTSWPSCRS